MPRPIQATLNLTALANNLNVIRQTAGNKKIWSVIKANAYGHGIAHVWQTLSTTDGFALLDLQDAVFLREAGWQGPILLLEGFFQPEDLAIIDQHRLTTTVHSFWQLNAIAQVTLNQPIDIYLKMNSGMNRLGFDSDCIQEAWLLAKANQNIANITLMTHFAKADTVGGIDDPFKSLLQICETIKAPLCLANSATTLWHSKAHGDWIRPGIILYGASPSGKYSDIAASGLQPVMTLHSEVIAIQTLSENSYVGYGGRYCATTTQRIGIVACGYADGYPRHAPTGTPILIDGVKTRLIGTVSMDMLAVDLTPCPTATIGSYVELWGENLPVDDVANYAGTIGYELLSALTTRVKIVSK